MKLQLNNFNNKHLGETIYIVGCAPHVNDLTSKQVESLRNKTVICVNHSFLKIEHPTYITTGHVDLMAYALEYTHKKILIFAHKSENTKSIEQIWNNQRVIPMWDLNPSVPLPRFIDEKNNINGSTSSTLSATHLAYIMGASKIIYVGFEETSQLHFYNTDKNIEAQMLSNIEKLLVSKKYWNPNNYTNSWQGIRSKIDVHSAFDVVLNRCQNAPDRQANLNRTIEDLKNSPFERAGCEQNTSNFSNYVSDLNKNGVETFTVALEGITIEAGCKQIDLHKI